MKKFYRAITKNIEVRVRPEFTDIKLDEDDNQIFFWRYFVTIKNNSSQSVQIIRRHWKIIDDIGLIQEISGEGVVGKQPLLVPQLEFEYDSYVELKHPSAIMGGFYEAKKSNGEIFKVKIPSFSLDTPGVNKMLIN